MSYSHVARTWTSPRRFPWALVAASAVILATAFALEHINGLSPCDLCLRQRYPWGAILLVSLLSACCARSRFAEQIWFAALLACIALALYGAYLAYFHVNVEQGLAVSQCNTPISSLRLPGPGEKIRLPPGCSNVKWRFLGLSLSQYNLLASLGAAAIVCAVIVLRVTLQRSDVDDNARQ
jgi:disulfide bond formation protein DsbB